MAEPPKDDEAKFNETLKRMLKTPPTPHKGDSRNGGKGRATKKARVTKAKP